MPVTVAVEHPCIMSAFPDSQLSVSAVVTWYAVRSLHALRQAAHAERALCLTDARAQQNAAVEMWVVACHRG